MACNSPFTLLIIIPANERLMATSEREAGADILAMMVE